MTYYPYETFVTDVKALVKQSATYAPDTLIAIARGGLTLVMPMLQPQTIAN